MALRAAMTTMTARLTIIAWTWPPATALSVRSARHATWLGLARATVRRTPRACPVDGGGRPHTPGRLYHLLS